MTIDFMIIIEFFLSAHFVPFYFGYKGLLLTSLYIQIFIRLVWIAPADHINNLTTLHPIQDDFAIDFKVNGMHAMFHARKTYNPITNDYYSCDQKFRQIQNGLR